MYIFPISSQCDILDQRQTTLFYPMKSFGHVLILYQKIQQKCGEKDTKREEKGRKIATKNKNFANSVDP